jgi:hypothetical protein
MEGRVEALMKLLEFKWSIKYLKKELSKFSWDVKAPLVTFSKKHLIDSLERTRNGEVAILELEEWANMIECREDIEFDDNKIKQYIFELANPYLYGSITNETIQNMLSALSD